MITISTEVLIAVIGSGALFTFVQFLINRHDNKNDKTKALQEAVDGLREELKQSISDVRKELTGLKDRNELQDATQARIRILRFDEELRYGREHTLEHFAAISEDMETYEKYYDAHPTLQNGHGRLAVRHIREVYAKLESEHKLDDVNRTEGKR